MNRVRAEAEKSTMQKHEAAMRAAESYESPEEAALGLDELHAEYNRLSDYKKAELIASSSKDFLRFTDIYMTDKLMGFRDLSELQLALRAIFLRLLLQMQSLSMLISPSSPR